jgi:peptide/nickel transport system ATP-binding protein
MVLYLGRIAELAPCSMLFSAPAHPYSRTLLQSIPLPHGDVVGSTLEGDVPDPRRPPSGCRFHPRCPVGPRANPERSLCTSEAPRLCGTDGTGGAVVACHFPLVGVS